MLRRLLITACSLLVTFVCVAPAICAEPADAPISEPYRQPNVHVDISEALLNAILSSNSRTRGPFREVIQGSTYRGMSTTDAYFSVRTEPAEDAVAFVLVWHATVNSNSRSSQQRTDVSSVSTTRIAAVKGVTWQADGLHVRPARSLAKSKSRITSVNSRRVIGRRAAVRRAYQQRSGVDYSVARRAEQRARQEFDRQMGAMLASWQADFDTRVRQPLAERGQLPQVIGRSSTADGLQFALLQASAEQYGTVTGLAARPTDQSGGDFSVSLHQSAINNFAEGLLAGEKLREDQLAEQLSKSLGWNPAGLAPVDPEKLWSIDFDQENPLRVEFHDSQVTLTMHARGFQVGEQLIPGARLRVVYKLNLADSGLTGTRQGRIEIEDLATGKPQESVGVRQQVFRTMLSKRFERLFPAEVTLTELPTPATWPPRATLHFATVDAQDEWLQLDCTLQKPQSTKLARSAE